MAAMRKQKGEFERAQCTHKRAKRDAAWFVFRSTGKMDYTARLFGQHRALQGRQKDLEGEVEEKIEEKKEKPIYIVAG